MKAIRFRDYEKSRCKKVPYSLIKTLFYLLIHNFRVCSAWHGDDTPAVVLDGHLLLALLRLQDIPEVKHVVGRTVWSEAKKGLVSGVGGVDGRGWTAAVRIVVRTKLGAFL